VPGCCPSFVDEAGTVTLPELTSAQLNTINRAANASIALTPREAAELATGDARLLADLDALSAHTFETDREAHIAAGFDVYCETCGDANCTKDHAHVLADDAYPLEAGGPDEKD
jgi:hypothetical protein